MFLSVQPLYVKVFLRYHLYLKVLTHLYEMLMQILVVFCFHVVLQSSPMNGKYRESFKDNEDCPLTADTHIYADIKTIINDARPVYMLAH